MLLLKCRVLFLSLLSFHSWFHSMNMQYEDFILFCDDWYIGPPIKDSKLFSFLESVFLLHWKMRRHWKLCLKYIFWFLLKDDDYYISQSILLFWLYWGNCIDSCLPKTFLHKTLNFLRIFMLSYVTSKCYDVVTRWNTNVRGMLDVFYLHAGLILRRICSFGSIDKNMSKDIFFGICLYDNFLYKS